MAINNFEDWKKAYEKPSIDGVIVGFSGIDPQKKSSSTPSDVHSGGDGCECDPNNLTEAQQTIVNEKISDRIRELEIRIDAGNIDPDADDDEAYPGYLEPSNIDHEILRNLLGGSEDGHYHLTQSEREKINSYPSYSDLSLSISQTVQHEKLLGLLGGDTNGHYHLTQAERTKLQGYPEFASLSESFNPNHEALSNLLGGNSDGHYHLTQAERTKLQGYPEFSNLSERFTPNHEALTNLLGGSATGGHYHLTQAERDKLQAYPEFSNISRYISSSHEALTNLLGGNDEGHYHLTEAERSKLQSYPELINLLDSIDVNHEKISGLLGGNTSGHYHLTDSERTNLLKIITALFPSGSTEPVLPSNVEDKLTRETWTFVLEDDTTYTKDVAIWI